MSETAQQAARRLLSSYIDRGYQPVALHEYVNADGLAMYYRARLEHPTERKVIRPMHANGNGWELKEPSFPQGQKPLYALDRIAADSEATVIVVEGEKAADALLQLGVVATTSGSAQSAEGADWSPLAGRTCVLWPDNDDAGREYIGDVGMILGKLGCKFSAVDISRLRLPPGGDAADWAVAHPEASLSDLQALPTLSPHPVVASAPEAVCDGPRAVVRRLCDIQAKPIRWLWPGRFARGKVSMIAGHPGLGKSQLTAALAAVVTTGGRWPVDKLPCERGDVILLNAEDDAADTIRPRLEAAGADLSRCEMLDAVVDGYNPDGTPSARGFSLKSDLRVLDQLLSVRPEAAMVVIDPVTAYLSGVDSHVNADVRALLAPLGELAARHEVAIVCVSHLNKGSPTKSGAGEALMRVSGSLAFVAAARAAFIVVRDQDDPNRRLFLPAKNNIGKDESGLAFSVESHNLPSGIETSRVMWEPAPVVISADEAMAAPPDEEERSMTDEAMDLLQAVLECGRLLSSEVKSKAKQAGIGDRALRTARTRLGIEVHREGFGVDTKTYWRFPKGSFVTSDSTHAHTRHMSPMEPDVTSGQDSASGLRTIVVDTSDPAEMFGEPGARGAQ